MLRGQERRAGRLQIGAVVQAGWDGSLRHNTNGGGGVETTDEKHSGDRATGLYVGPDRSLKS